MSPASYLTAPPRVAAFECTPRRPTVEKPPRRARIRHLGYDRPGSPGRAPHPWRVAAVDLGTNATRLLVADVAGDSRSRSSGRTRITRLGEGVDERRRLLPLPVARVRNVLTDFRREAEALGAERVLAVATSAVRDADNGEAFLGEVEWSYGFATRLLTGDEEAAMTLRGVGPLDPGVLVTDIGGGSTELVSDTFRRSVDIGCVRLAERFGDDLGAAAAAIDAALRRRACRGRDAARGRRDHRGACRAARLAVTDGGRGRARASPGSRRSARRSAARGCSSPTGAA